MMRIPTRWAIASALVAMMAASCTTSTEDTSTDGGGTGGGSTGGSSGSGGSETGGSDTGGSAGTGGSESEAGTGGSTEEAGAMSACEACGYGNCGAEGTACDADPSCKAKEDAFYECAAEPGADIATCALTFTGAGDPDASADSGAAANALAGCVASHCTEICAGGGSDAGTAGD
jgi:hypothetical protein